MAWVKVGQLQKGKIFTVYSGETFDLKWYSDNINWENPVVIGQVSSIYFDRLYTAGFKAIIQHIGGTSYTAFTQSSGVIDTSGGDSSGWTQNVVQQGVKLVKNGYVCLAGLVVSGEWNLPDNCRGGVSVCIVDKRMKRSKEATEVFNTA